MTWPGKNARALLITCIAALCPVVLLGAGTPGDSTSRGALTINPRINSTGYFPYTGSVLNHHLNADVNFFYEKGSFGGFLFKSQDLADAHSYINYLQPGIFIVLNRRHALYFRAVFGYLFNQTHHFRDDDSDIYAAGIAYWQISDHVRVENTTLFFDCTIQNKVANRLLLSVKGKKAKMDLYLWHRLVFETRNNSDAFSAALTFPIIHLGESTDLQLTSAWITYVSKERPSYALKQGFVFTLAMPMEFQSHRTP